MGYADCAAGPGGSKRGRPPPPLPLPAKTRAISKPQLCHRILYYAQACVPKTYFDHPLARASIAKKALVLASGYYRHPLKSISRAFGHNVYYQTLRACIAGAYATVGRAGAKTYYIK